MHGQRDLLDWQDEDKKKEWKERPAGMSKQRREKMLRDGEWSEKEQWDEGGWVLIVDAWHPYFNSVGPWGLDRTSRILRTLAMEIPLSHWKLETRREVGAVAVLAKLPSESRQAGDQADSDYQTFGLIWSRQGG
jgi:hypothetical protein